MGGKYEVNDSGTERRGGGGGLWKMALALGLLAVLLTQRHQVVGAIRGLSFLPGAVDRAEAAALRVRALLEVELAAMNLSLGDPVFLRVLKEEGVVEVWMRPGEEGGYTHYKTYLLCLPPGVSGEAAGEGRQAVPEGFYQATRMSLRPHHRHYLAVELADAAARGLPPGRTSRPVYVQGDCVLAGSVGLSNPNMEELYTLVAAAFQAGQEDVQVHVFPFRLTDLRMNREQADAAPRLEWWANLKEGYDFFEIVRHPPRMGWREGRYAFELPQALLD